MTSKALAGSLVNLHWAGSLVRMPSVMVEKGSTFSFSFYPRLPSAVISSRVKPKGRTLASGVMMGLVASLGLMLTHFSSFVPSLTSAQSCPRLLHLYNEQGLLGFSWHLSQSLPPVGACQGSHVTTMSAVSSSAAMMSMSW